MARYADPWAWPARCRRHVAQGCVSRRSITNGAVAQTDARASGRDAGRDIHLPYHRMPSMQINTACAVCTSLVCCLFVPRPRSPDRCVASVSPHSACLPRCRLPPLRRRTAGRPDGHGSTRQGPDLRAVPLCRRTLPELCGLGQRRRHAEPGGDQKRCRQRGRRHRPGCCGRRAARRRQRFGRRRSRDRGRHRPAVRLGSRRRRCPAIRRRGAGQLRPRLCPVHGRLRPGRQYAACLRRPRSPGRYSSQSPPVVVVAPRPYRYGPYGYGAYGYVPYGYAPYAYHPGW